MFIPIEQRERVVEALRALTPVPTDRADAESDGWEEFMVGRTPVDVFYSYDSFHAAMRDQRRRFPFAGEELPFLAAEQLAACKAIFDRPKDWLDIDQMLFGLTDFDAEEATRWIEHVVGHGDPRLARFVAAVNRLR